MSIPQVPINSGFGAASTAAGVIKGINLAGKTTIVTGGYSGMWMPSEPSDLPEQKSSFPCETCPKRGRT